MGAKVQTRPHPVNAGAAQRKMALAIAVTAASIRAMQKISLLTAALLASVPAAAMPPPLPDVAGKDAATLQAEMTAGETSSEVITAAYLERIRNIDKAGPTLNAVIAVFPGAMSEAYRLDQERKAGHVRGPLHGIPVLLKDNIEAAGPVATTAGSLALKGNITGRDAPLVARLREGGAVILGKTNLSEWANIRSNDATSGWSAVGGLTRNPHALDRNTCGQPCAADDRDRDRRIDHLPFRHERRGRLQTDRRPGEPQSCRPDQPQSGYGGTDDVDGARRGHAVVGDGGQRSRRPGDGRGRRAPP